MGAGLPPRGGSGEIPGIVRSRQGSPARSRSAARGLHFFRM